MKFEITKTSIYTGPSVYAQTVVVHCSLAGTRRRPSRALVAAVQAALPGLREHRCECGAPQGFDSAAGGSEAIGHLFEHVCIELQNLAGAQLSCLRAQSLVALDAMDAVVPYEDAEVGAAAGSLAAELMAAMASRPVGSGADEGDSRVIASRIEEFIEFAVRTMLPVQDRALIRTARARDIPVARQAGRTLLLGHGRRQRRLSATKTSLTNIVSNDLAANKDYSRRILADVGLPVPRYERVYGAPSAARAARRIGYPVVVKPNNANMGAGVSVGMSNRREVRAAYKRAREFDRSALVEELVEGADYRMLVIGGKLRAAAKRVPGHIVGDGLHTIAELLAETNRDPRRGSGPTCSWTRIKFDEQAERLVAERGWTLESVPPAGEIVYLRRNANTSDGGTAVDVTDEVHADNRDIAERAARAIGLDIAGVDLLTRDISTSMWENGGRICEINSRPGVRKHLWPAQGEPRDVLTPIIEMLFPPGCPARIPVVAVTGTGDTATLAHMLAHVLSGAGHHVGLSAAGRVYSGGRPAGRAPVAASAATRMILFDPDVELAVLELRPEDVLSFGVDCDAVDVVVVVDDSAAAGDHAAAIRAVARCARDVVYVADSNPCADAIGRDGGRAELCRVVARPGGQRVVARSGGASVMHDHDAITVSDAKGELGRIRLGQCPKEQQRGQRRWVEQCSLYAVAVARDLGMAPDDIQQALGTFRLPLEQLQ